MARFEAATLAGIGVGIVAAGPLYEVLGRGAFLLNAGIYALSYVIYRWGVGELGAAAGDQEAIASGRHERFDLARYRRVLASPGVWLLAPTWVALNAVLGSWTTQSVFQLVREPSGHFSGQLLMGGFAPTQVSIGMALAMVVFFAGLFYWGNRFRRFRRTTIIGIGIGGGLLMMAAVFVINHSQGAGLLLQAPMVLLLMAGLFILAGATPAALGLLADISESHPADRGAIMGLYSVFLAIGQIVGALVSGWAADWLGIDGLLAASLLLLVVALLPLRQLRASEHLVGERGSHGVPDPIPG